MGMPPLEGQIYINTAPVRPVFEYTPQGVIHSRDSAATTTAFIRALGARDAQDKSGRSTRHRHALKFSTEGRILMTSGRREDPVEMLSNMPGTGRFHGRNREVPLRPTDRCRLRSQGNIFVSDGEFDGRVVK